MQLETGRRVFMADFLIKHNIFERYIFRPDIHWLKMIFVRLNLSAEVIDNKKQTIIEYILHIKSIVLNAQCF